MPICILCHIGFYVLFVNVKLWEIQIIKNKEQKHIIEVINLFI